MSEGPEAEKPIPSTGRKGCAVCSFKCRLSSEETIANCEGLATDTTYVCRPKLAHFFFGKVMALPLSSKQKKCFSVRRFLNIGSATTLQPYFVLVVWRARGEAVQKEDAP